uniref:Chromosome partitioning protein ParB n=2 Tax=Vibrio algicola TaxID=2662262 RepID=A0A5Q0TN54_9VIBR
MRSSHVNNGLKRIILTVAAFLLPVALVSAKQNIPHSEGDVVSVSLGDLHPTQALIGRDQVLYKLANYQKKPKNLFDDVCEANGQKGIKDFDQNSKPNKLDSFTCLESIGREKSALKTVVIAPNGQLYLTDGHHTFTTFWAMPNGGPDFPIHVLIAKDYRNGEANLQSGVSAQKKQMTEFWQQMQQDKNTWLFNVAGDAITPQELPKQLDLKQFQDSPMRSMLYFTKGVSWDKPDVAVPFLEFYWAKALSLQLAENRDDLTTESGFVA